MFCKNCGKEVADGAGFCPHCGATLAGAPAPAPTPAPSDKPAPAGAKGKLDPLNLSALICLSVGVLFLMIFCFKFMGDLSDITKFVDGGGMAGVIVSLLSLCAIASSVFVLVCLWLIFGGKLSATGAKLEAQGQKLLSVSLLIQLIVEAVVFGLIVLMLLVAKDELMGRLAWTFMRVFVGIDVRDPSVVMPLIAALLACGAFVFLHVTAMQAVKTRRPSQVAAIACFIAGGFHILTILITMNMGDLGDMGDGYPAIVYLMLLGLGAADILYGVNTMLKLKK